jgi:mRNA interferase MazF
MIRGRVVLVPFPFDDLSSTKLRPAVCLTDPIGSYEHVVVAFISSRIPTDLMETDLLLDSSQDDFRMTGLRISSVLRLHRLMTLTTALFQRELGSLPSRMQEEVDLRLRRLFGLG